MNLMTTYSGINFDPKNPVPELIDIIDIAHPLSLICRANGHVNYFYSVAQHSINCATEAKARGYTTKVQLICLLHDASEAYIADIIRPVKPSLSNYEQLEYHLQNTIYNKYINEPITKENLEQMKIIDDDILGYEFSILMNKSNYAKPTIYGNLNFDKKDTEIIEQQFLKLFNELTSLH